MDTRRLLPPCSSISISISGRFRLRFDNHKLSSLIQIIPILSPDHRFLLAVSPSVFGRSTGSIVVEFWKSTRAAAFLSSTSSAAANSRSMMEFSWKVSDWRCIGDAVVVGGDSHASIE
ncbi:hypothetical protein Q3G72_003291 [Acer saccharum]|nr:hypothetical protein Q3G72_003291 [Acer saccharum]